MPHAHPISFFWFDNLKNIWCGVQIIKLLII
jgi:hypothetical protein